MEKKFKVFVTTTLTMKTNSFEVSADSFQGAYDAAKAEIIPGKNWAEIIDLETGEIQDF